MLTVKLLLLELGALLLYAGITGRSVGALLRGDNTKQVANTSLTGGTVAGAQNPAQILLAGGYGTQAPAGSPQTARQTYGYQEPVSAPLFANAGASSNPFTTSPGGNPFPAAG